jgi:signal transduction histidine kinase
MTVEELQEQLARTEATVHALQMELAETNHGLVAMALELEQRLDERDAQLRAAQAALEQSNANLASTTTTVRLLQEELAETNRGLVALTLELEQRVDARTVELRQLNLELEERVQDRTAQLRQANDNLQNFAHTAAHDLRSPLRAMRSLANIAVEEHGPQLDSEGQSVLQRIEQSAAHMQHLLDDLLEYSKMGEEELELEPVSLQDAVRDALALLEADIHAKNAIVAVADSLPEIIGHPATVVLLINNFVSNALKFIAPGVQPRIRIWAENMGLCVRLSVQDNGIGIAQTDLRKVFEVFQRLHGKGAYPGTGLGLAIVRKGAERMGGQVGVESEPGKGSHFWVELKRANGQPHPTSSIP